MTFVVSHNQAEEMFTSGPKTGSGSGALRLGAGLSGRAILYVINDPSFFLSHRLNIGLEAQRRGAKVCIVSPGDESAAGDFGMAVRQIVDYGFRHIELPLSRWGSNPFRELRTLGSLVEIYRKERPDLVHHATIKPVLYGSIASRIVGVPAVNAISGMGHVFVSKGFFADLRRRLVLLLYRVALGGAKLRVIFQNEDDRLEFLQNDLVPKSRTVIIRGSGVNPNEYRPQETENSVPTVLFLGRLLETKGIRDFVAAARSLLRSGVKARFLLAGDVVPNNPGSVSAMEVEQWQQEGLVEPLGHVKDVKSIINTADIVCLPSYREGLPRALIEAASCGRPLVATDAPGCREIVVNNRNGFLVPVQDPISLAGALSKLIVNRELRDRFGAESRRMVLEDGFAEEQVVAATMALYDELLG